MLEVRLLYKKLENYNKVLEQTVQERTAELQESEARYRSLTELASDWYWEQDENMNFTKVSGPVREMLGIQIDTLVDEPSVGETSKDRAKQHADNRLERGGTKRATSNHCCSPTILRLRIPPDQC